MIISSFHKACRPVACLVVSQKEQQGVVENSLGLGARWT